MITGSTAAGTLLPPAAVDPELLRFRLAQTRRLLRYCHERGADATAVIAGTDVLDLSEICDADGRVLPEAADLLAVQDLVLEGRKTSPVTSHG